jgi:hypoxanthine-DNA glycosylase
VGAETEIMKVGLAPIAPKNSLLFILGSLPGDASLTAGRYYAHPTNQFWRLLGRALHEDLAPLDYEERLRCLSRRRVGLWDVIAAAERPGSLDQAIRNAEHNRIDAILNDYPDVRAIAFNGAAAAAIGTKLLRGIADPPHLITLPSSSAANTTSFEEKSSRWADLAHWAGAKDLRQA